MHYAVSRHWTITTRLLLRHGADPRISDDLGNTPLHQASLQQALLCLDPLLNWDSPHRLDFLTIRNKAGVMAEEVCHATILPAFIKARLEAEAHMLQRETDTHPTLATKGLTKRL